MDDLTSEAEEGIREMMQERLIVPSDEYDSEEDGENEFSEDSFEQKYGEKRIEVLEEKPGYHSKEEPRSKRKDSKVSESDKSRDGKDLKGKNKKDKKKKK